MSAKFLAILAVTFLFSAAVEGQLGAARAVDITDKTTNSALTVAKDQLATVPGLCDKAIIYKSGTQQVTKGTTYKFIFDVTPKDCGTSTSTWTTCEITVQLDVEASTSDKPVLNAGPENCK
ncbi:hypothetical protein CHUAL_001041 [Chamberlinius hualienensis]